MPFRAAGCLALVACMGLQPFLGAAEGAGAAPAPAWEQVGWGGGSFYFAAAWHPTAENVIYLGSDCAGAFRSEDKAKLWRFANRGICDYAVYSLAVSPASPDQVYALTDGGLCKSVDRAKTWEFIADSAAAKLDIRSARNGSVRAVAIDPRNAEVVYAGSHTGTLHKTEDGGRTWRELTYRDALPKPKASPSFHGAGALALAYGCDAAGMETMGRVSKTYGPGAAAKDWSAYKKLSVHVLLPGAAPVLQAQLVVQTGDAWLWQAGTWIDGKPGEWIDVSLDLATIKDLASVRMLHVVLRSPQAAWKGEVLIDAVALHSDAAGTVGADHDPDGTSTVLVADWEKPGDSDGWSANREFKDCLHVTAASQSQKKQGGDTLSSVAVAASEPATVYVSNTMLGVFRSDDAGASWTALDAPKKVLDVVVSTRDAGVVWAACGADGIHRSLDRGKTWTAMNEGLTKGCAIREIALHPAKPDLVYAIGSVGWGGSLFRSDDGGKSWSHNEAVRAGIPGNPTLPADAVGAERRVGLSTVTNLAVNPKNPDELFICGNWRNVFSADGGKTLEERSTGADNTCATDIQFLNGKTYATAMDEGLMVSENDGGEWRQLIPLTYSDNVSGHFWRVRVAKSGASTRIVTTASPWKSFADPTCANRAYVSEDDGKTFAISSAGLPDYVPNVNCMWGRSFPRALAADPNHPDVIYLGMDGDPEPARKLPGGGIFRSVDGGKSWTRCAGQPGGLRMYYGLVVDPSDSKRLFYSCCGEGGGGWRSEDEGATWEHVFTAEPWCFNIEVAPSGKALVGGKNLHRSTDHGKTWTKITNFSGDATIVGIAVDPADEKRMWISRTTWNSSDDGGIFRTTDDGATWQEITGDIPFRKPQILRYNPETHYLWAAGAPIFKLKQ